MSKLRKILISTTAGLVTLGVAASVALAQGGMMGQGQGMGPGMQQTPGQGMGPGMMGPGQGMAPGMMGPGMMGPGMQQMPGMTGQGPGMRVTPSQHLTTDDVSHFLGHFLQRHGNPRLEVGEVRELDEDTITAEIVTVDDSLVQRWQVDRHTGQMMPEAAGGEEAQPRN